MKIHIILDTDNGNISYTIEGKNINKPQSETSRLKKFMDIYNKISNNGRVEIKEEHLTQELILGGFLAQEINEYINKAMLNGQIYEVKSGWYNKA